MILALVLAVALVLTVSYFRAMNSPAPEPTIWSIPPVEPSPYRPEPTVAPTTPSLEPTPTPERPELYRWKDRPRWAEWEALIDRLYTTYDPLVRSGEIYDLLPHGKAVGRDYVETYRLAVAEYQVLMIWLGSESTDPEQMDNSIHGWITLQTEWERQLLAGEHITFSMRVSGKLYDGTNQALATAHQPEPIVSEDAAAYEFVRAYQPALGADGTYRAAGAEIAKAFGLGMRTTMAELLNYCPTAGRLVGAAGVYCSGSPNYVYMPEDMPGSNYPDFVTNPDYLHVVRHEMAHALIAQKCGTTSPPIAGDRYEGVTNSFAVIYLGADYLRMSEGSHWGLDYTMTEETAEMAKQIMGGRCS